MDQLQSLMKMLITRCAVYEQYLIKHVIFNSVTHTLLFQCESIIVLAARYSHEGQNNL